MESSSISRNNNMLYTYDMRLDKYLCDTTLYTRKEAKEFIKKGKVLVNNEVIKDNGFIVNENEDSISLAGEILKYEKFVYYMLNKPAGYVCANTDNVSKTVFELFKDEGRDDLFTVGRLDKDTVGFLIITNDGDFAHHLTSPKHHVEKTYYVKSLKPLSDSSLDILSKGVEIEKGVITKPAVVKIISSNESLLTISEGMFHEVKRMYKAVDNEVLFLKRISIGKINLDESLSEGAYRRLSEDEIRILKEGL